MGNSTVSISGLSYQSDYMSADDEAHLVADIEHQPWITDLKRRVQHYGYRYDYTRRTVDPEMYLGPLPPWIMPLAQRLHNDGIFATVPNQVIVNEYEPGQGISAHIDCIPCFGDVVASISLLSSCMMVFTRTEPVAQLPVFVEPCSLLVMQGEARYQWKHAIPGRKVDDVQGKHLARGRRISLTFRTISRDSWS